MRFAYVMDPLERLLPDKDTTFAIVRAAQARGHEALHVEPRDLFVEGGDLYAYASRLSLSRDPPHHALGPREAIKVAETQGVLIRKDPPFDQAYLYATLLLERVRNRTTLVNDPRGLREANEKLYTLHFSRHTPMTWVGANRDAIVSFMSAVGGRAVIKPLDGAGGAGVMRLSEGDKNNRCIIDLLTREGTSAVLVQEYLEDVVRGDKRVLLLDGRILGAINRVPREDDLRSNIHVGGRVEPCRVTARERDVVEDIAPRLRADGLVFVGLDFIGERLTEINVTSPTGIQELSKHEGRDVAADVVEWLEKKAEELRPVLRSIPAG